MARHLTNAQIQTILAKTGGNMKPTEVLDLAALLERTSYVKDPDGGASGNAVAADETIMTTLFPSGTQQW